ncbi:SDR family oxidoreductase [Gymnodinialimonas ceratoperidinii]|uniref:SDR family oxidoreductase n=1 Tax=Gymnodinialimonas ceratoperidinii TaxID=2856823 RepID=A0A8F6TZB8_9RHOB|nr:SDR family oxidoreductase [Gymnodinialimonas ceratoperidinii]QXT40486.1 SDR family oxidoreductase [Gymnodinialimonas ceratoperidinii]
MRTILITGASSGIGRATAEAFLADGWRVALVARRAPLLAEVAGDHPNALALPADVTQLAEMEDAVARVVTRWGRLDAVFNNAGIFTPQGTIDEIDVSDWHQSLAVNLTGMFNTARAAFAQMRAQDPQGGRIINNGSLSAHAPREGSICYTTTKHGVTGLTKTLSLDGRPFNIAAGQIDIGNARTDLVDALNERRRADGKPLMDMMNVKEAAQSVLHMANMPASANVLFQTVLATKMPFVGRG